MKRLSIALVVAATSAAPACAQARLQAATSVARVGDAIASVSGNTVLLADREVVHRWSIDRQGHVTTTQLADPATGSNWSSPASPDFSLTLDSATTSSTSGWTLIGASASRIPADPARPFAGQGVQVVFRYAAVAAQPDTLELDRTWTLHPSEAVQGVSSVLVDHAPAPFRVGVYSLAELTSTAGGTAEVLSYHGGSDWRQDFRVPRSEPATFDDPGEVSRFDAGGGRGWFFVAERRGGLLNRAGRDAHGRTWIGVDTARDLLDAGPILTSPPNYNTVGNPAYPAPVRQRTVPPYGQLDLGRAYLGVYHGGAQQAAAVFVHDFSSHEMPTFARSVDLNSFHPWGHGRGLSDLNLRRQVDVFKALGGEIFMLDDQWQGPSAGYWGWYSQRFPISHADGVPKFVNYLHRKGVALGLWMSPAEFNRASRTFAAHKSWACTPTGDVTAQLPDDNGFGVWDMTNPALRSYLTSVIDRLVAQDGVREFKFDYVVWVDCPPHDYLDYEDAYAGWVREQEARHPGVTFELDETNDQRLWPLRSVALGPSWFDNGHLHHSSYPARLLHDVWSSAPWIPPSTLGFGTYDGTLRRPYTVDYLMPIGLLGHFTFWSNLVKLSPAQRRETAWWIAWYKLHRSALGGLVYEDTSADPIDGRSWAAFQPWSAGHGFLFVFRQGSAARTRTIRLRGLVPTRAYELTNVRTGASLGPYTGAALARGLRVTLPRVYSASVFELEGSGG